MIRGKLVRRVLLLSEKRDLACQIRFVPNLDSKLPAHIAGQYVSRYLGHRRVVSARAAIPFGRSTPSSFDGAGRRIGSQWETVAWRRTAYFKLDALAL